MSGHYPTYKAKAGRFTFDSETKKVRVCKDKGLLTFYMNADQENHLSWVNTDKNVEQIDLIVFPFDTHFEQVTGQKNTFVLRFQSNDDRYFFYLQEKIDPEQFLKMAKEMISYFPPEEMESEEKQVPAERLEKMEIEEPVKEEAKEKPEIKGFSPDFLARLTNNLMAASKKQSNDVTHLSKILTPEAINAFLGQLTEDDKNGLLEFLPEEQRSVEFIASNLRSPQFQQSADTLSDALNSENVIPLFLEMNLDQKHLKKYYGVHAFLHALQEWAAKQEKKEA